MVFIPSSTLSGGGANGHKSGPVLLDISKEINIMNHQNPQTNVQTFTSQSPNSGIQTTSMPQVSQPNQAVTSPAQSAAQPTQELGPGEECHSIWQGLLEWIEKPKNPTDQQKVTKHVPCQVSANSIDGEPALKADGWPQKLIMQLMPRKLIRNIGGAYLRNSKSVLVHPQPCEALESLTKVMSSGFAGCVHLTSIPNSAAKVLILIYTPEIPAYSGFIPNDQASFVDRLREVIQQEKSIPIMHQTQCDGGQTMNPQASGSLNMGGTNPATSQTSQQGLMMFQTNTMAMGEGSQMGWSNPATSQEGTAAGDNGVLLDTDLQALLDNLLRK